VRLSDALLAPALPDSSVSPEVWRHAVDGLPRVLAGLAAGAGGRGPLRLRGHDIRIACTGGEGPGSTGAAVTNDEPFAWSARTAQRALGLAALRRLVDGASRTPSDAVRAVVADATRLVGGGWRAPSSLEQWLGSLPPAGRAAAGAPAVTWVTRLWCAIDWDALAERGPVVLGRDDWWDSPHTSLLALRSRAEVRTGSAHLVVLNGARRASARAELSLVTLVEALRTRGESVPGVVVGWWPDSGHLVRVEPELAVLDRGVAAVGAVLRSRRIGVAA
jgi:hypothetical protein